MRWTTSSRSMLATMPVLWLAAWSGCCRSGDPPAKVPTPPVVPVRVPCLRQHPPTHPEVSGLSSQETSDVVAHYTMVLERWAEAAWAECGKP